MASTTNATLRKGSVKEDSNDCFSNTGSSAVQKAQNGNSTFNASCAAPLEATNEISFARELLENPFGAFSRTPSFVPAIPGTVSIHSFNMEDGRQSINEQQTNTRPTKCSAVVDFYSNSLIRFRNSRFFYVFQFLVGLLPLSAIAVGIKFAKSCKAAPSFPVFTIIIAIFGLLFIGLWISINIYHHGGRPCTGQQKFLIRLCLSFIAILMSLELYLFYNMSPSFDLDAINYCNETFFYYTHYKYIALGGILAIVIILYFPGFPRFICSLHCSRPPAPAASYESL